MRLRRAQVNATGGKPSDKKCTKLVIFSEISKIRISFFRNFSAGG